jgi:acyl CoA:acetate/3-ketoacid CoA transferase beta subunit
MATTSGTRAYIAAIAHELHDGERLHVGANQVDVAAAAHLARRLWAPRLRCNIAGCWAMRGPLDTALLGRNSYERDLVADRRATFWQARVFDDLRRTAIVFAGGLQVDGRGNANLIGIRDGDRLVVRGPGSAGLPTLTTFAPRFYMICPSHEPRFLVPAVSAVSVVGDPAARERVGLDPNALTAVITPLARFEPSPDGLVLTETAPGVGIDEVASRTGFELCVARDVRERPAVTAQEAELLDEILAAADRNAGVPSR